MAATVEDGYLLVCARSREDGRMTGALARIEARHLAPPLLWLSFALALALMTVSQLPFMSWPVLAGDDLYGYQTGYLLSGGPCSPGPGWGCGTARPGRPTSAVTPTAPGGCRGRGGRRGGGRRRVFAVAFATALAVSTVRGVCGMPGCGCSPTGCWRWCGRVGRVRGRAVQRPRMASVLAAPVWVGVRDGGWLAGDVGGEPALAVQRLAPLLAFNSATDRSAEFGFLPDSLWPHLGYLLGLVLLAGVGLLLLAARGGGQPPRPARALAAILAGVVLVTAGGMGVVILPHRLVVLGPDRADWRPLSQVTAESGDRPWSYPDDGHARICAGSSR